MGNRNRAVTILLFVFLAITAMLQVMSMRRSARLADRLGHLADVLKDALENRAQSTQAQSDDQEYPGDEGDWLIWAMHLEPRTLNQLSIESDIYSRWITVGNIFEPLLEYDWDEVKMVPRLAESYRHSSDGLEITFTLRADARFSDGVAVTTDDVIFTYETIMNPLVDSSHIAHLYKDVDRVVKVSDRVVKFVMKKPYFKALEIASFWDIGIHPKHIYEFDDAQEFNKRVSDPVGSGPYVFDSWRVGSRIVLRRNENYWGRKPKLKKVAYRFIPNDVARLQALRAHEVDMIIPSQEQFADLLGDEQFNEEFDCVKYWNPGAPFYYIGWNEDTPFFADRVVRLAMTHMVNREQIVSSLLKGMGQEISGPFYVKGTQSDESIKPWPYDLERARELLDEAGWVDSDGDGIRDKDGIKFSFRFMYDSSNLFYQRLVKLVADDAAKVGVEVLSDPFEWSIIMERVVDHKFEAVSLGWGGDIVEDFYQIFHSSQSDNRGSNYVSFRDEKADELLEMIRVTLDEGVRDELSGGLHRILHEQQPYTFLYARPTFRLMDKRYENVNIHYMGLNYLEWYVPNKKQRYK